MSLVRFFNKRKNLKRSNPDEISLDYVQIRCWHRYVEDEEGSACIALTMDNQTHLIYCNYAGNIKNILCLQSDEETLRLALMELGECDFFCQYAFYKAIIKQNVELLFESDSDNTQKLRKEFADYNNDVKALIWNIFTTPVDYENQTIGWGNLQKCLKLKLNFDKPEPLKQTARGRGRGYTV